MNVLQDALNPYYPPQPGYRSLCQVNEIYQTIPPSSINPASYPVEWQETTYGPTSVKHIYTGIPNFYPYQSIKRPFNTLYGRDFSQYHEHGESGKGKRIGYTYKPYPFTNINNKEVRIYSDKMLPYMDPTMFTKYPVIRGDASLNSPLQTHPYAYNPE